MYRRYDPKPNLYPPRPGKPPVSDSGSSKRAPQVHNDNSQKKVKKTPTNPILGLGPSSLYNPETKKVLGFLSADDLLLAALILVLLDSECSDDSLLIYVLIYVLISDYIELPF